MRHPLSAACGLALGLAALSPVQAQNIEDLPLQDEPIPTAPPTPVSPPPVAVFPVTPTVTASPVVPPVIPPPTISTGDTVTIPRAVWEQLLHDVEDLKRSRAQAPVVLAPPDAPPIPVPTPATGSKNYLLLPDISLVLQARGLISSDKRDDERNRSGLAEGELAVQGYIYPGVKADAFLVAAPGEDEAAQFEEGYVTFLGVKKGLNINVGRKFAPFGRTGELHNHSWLYPRQLLPIRNLVSEEALAGDGVNLNYVLPTGKNLFARASLGVFSGQGSEARINQFDRTNPFVDADTLMASRLASGTGAGYGRRFYNARLWMGRSFGDNTEVDFGLSHARGTSSATRVIDDGTGTPTEAPPDFGRVVLNGVDFTYRRFMGAEKRLLLRAERFQHKPQDLPTSSASGFYALANFKASKFRDYGLLYERSGFPNAPGLREKAFSLIYTHRLTEQFYLRAMGTRGDRPGSGSYDELRLQLTAGLGPHTHNLE